MTAQPATKPEPGTEAYFEANQDRLCIFILALVKGCRSARTERGTRIRPMDWKDRRAAVRV